jgi:hypothetical protein
LLANSTNGFGVDRVKGRSLVPNPPTRISAFILQKLFLFKMARISAKTGNVAKIKDFSIIALPRG